MRDYQFRGRNINGGEWVFGGYHKHIKRTICPVGDELKEDDICHLIIQSGFSDWNMPKPLCAIEVNGKTVGQSMELNDKNKKLIFEDDIVKAYDGQTVQINVVQYDELMARWVLWNPKYAIHGDHDEIEKMACEDNGWWIEVIGNIHENADLLPAYRSGLT